MIDSWVYKTTALPAGIIALGVMAHMFAPSTLLSAWTISTASLGITWYWWDYGG